MVTKNSNSPWRFLARIAVFATPLLVVIAAGEFFLHRGRETWSVERAHRAQRANPNRLFMRQFLAQDLLRYKLTGTRYHPGSDVIVLGSSRVMGFRDEMLLASLYNAGGVLQQASDLRDFVDLTRDQTAPSVIVVGIDMWWFNRNYEPGSWPLSTVARQETVRSWRAHWQGLRQLLLDSTRRPQHIARLFSAAGSSEHIGYAAMSGGGFRADGSMRRSHSDPTRTFVDREKPPFRERIRQESMQFAGPWQVDEIALARFESSLRSLAARGPKLALLLPPMCGEARDLLDDSPSWMALEATVRARLQQLARQLQAPLIDLPRTRDLGLDDRYLFDCVHGDDVLAVHLLNAMAEHTLAPAPLAASRQHLQHLTDLAANAFWTLPALESRQPAENTPRPPR